jgi:hypothetical protein
MNGMIERATEMPNVNNVASDTMDEEDVKALVLSLEEHGVEHQKTKALIRRIEQRVGAERAAELKARAEDRAFGRDKKAPRSQLAAGKGTGDAPEKVDPKYGAYSAQEGQPDTKKELRSKTGEGRAPFRGGQDTDAKVKVARGPRGGTGDAPEKAGAAAGGGRGDTGR